MTGFLLQRIGHSVLVLAVLLTLVFVLGYAIGDPASLMAGPDGTAEQIEAIRELYGLNDPLHVRFAEAAWGWIRGDFGNSFWQNRPAMELALERLPATLFLTACTLAIAVPLALIMGMASAIRPRSLADRAMTAISMAGVSIPNFWLALMLILVVAVQLRWLPTSGSGGWQHVILPALTLAFPQLGQLAQMTRNTMLEELGRQYITTARAKGLSRLGYVTGHAFRNASIPILTLGGNELASLVNGAVIVETVFGWPGIGQLLIQAIERRDLPLVSAIVFVIAAMTLVINIAIDLAYTKLDPRISMTGSQGGGH